MHPDTSYLIRIILFFSTLSAILCGVTYKILKRRLGFSHNGNLILAVFILIIFLSLIIGPIEYRMARPDPALTWSYCFQTAQYFLMGWIGVVFIIFCVTEFLQTFFILFDPKKRVFLTEGVARGLLGAVSLSTAVGFAQAKSGPQIKNVLITLPHLPAEFKGLKITQISDVHIGPIILHDFLENVVTQVMSTEPDLIFITGDLVDGTPEQLAYHIEPLRKLKAKDGVYFCTGNHEYYSGAEAWITYLESMGIHVFKNSNVILSRPNATAGASKILIGGVYDYKAEQMLPAHKTDPHLAAKTSENVAVKLLLAHNPHSINEGAKAGFDIQFSGHTHAGQFYPFVWIVKLILPYSEGLYHINEKTQLYVNRGTGYWGPPNRLGKSSEITAFTLSS